MRADPRLKTLFIIIFATLIIALAVILTVVLRRRSAEVPVVPVSELTTTWANESSINSGIVSSDVKQIIYLSSSDLGGTTLVYNGQFVSEGTPLYEYDTTLLELRAEIYELDLALIKNRITRAKTELSSFKRTYSVQLAQIALNSSIDPEADGEDIPAGGIEDPTPSPTATADHDPVAIIGILDGDTAPYEGDGTLELPYLFLLRSGGRISSDFILKYALEDKEMPVYCIVEMREDNSFTGEIITKITIIFWPDGSFEYEIALDTEFAPYDPPEPTVTAGPSETPGVTDDPDATATPDVTNDPDATATPDVTDDPDTTASPDITASPSPSPTRAPSPTRTPVPTANTYGLTSAQIKSLYNSMERELAELELSQKQLELNLKTTNKKLSDKILASAIDGVVALLAPADEAIGAGKAFMTISGTGGYLVRGNMSEFDYELLNVGQEVDITSRITGNIHTGRVIEIGTTPESGARYNAGGNGLASYYSFSVYVEEENAFADGEQVALAIKPSGGELSSVYLERAYVAEDSGGSYILFANEYGVLEKQYIVTGRILWGYYVEVLSGLCPDCYLAFPYSPDAREQVRAAPSEAVVTVSPEQARGY